MEEAAGARNVESGFGLKEWIRISESVDGWEWGDVGQWVGSEDTGAIAVCSAEHRECARKAFGRGVTCCGMRVTVGRRESDAT